MTADKKTRDALDGSDSHRWKAPEAAGHFQHKPDSPGAAVALAVVVAEATAGGIPRTPVELTLQTWKQFWQQSVAAKARKLNPPPSRSWKALIKELSRKEGVVTVTRWGPPGTREHHEVRLELLAPNLVRVSFRSQDGC